MTSRLAANMAPLVLMFSLLLMMSMLRRTESNVCERRPVIITIQRPGCFPRRLIAFACRGTCTSYARTSFENPTEIQRFCQCCDVDDSVSHLAAIACQNMAWTPGQHRFRQIGVNMNLPAACRCRPCSQTPQYIAATDSEHWQNSGKRSYHSMRYAFDLNTTDRSENSKNPSAPFIIFDDPDIQFTVEEL